MKKFTIAVFAFASICIVSCKKESINPKKDSINKVEMMNSGGGDKRPSSHFD
jgi:hypothetical protein